MSGGGCVGQLVMRSGEGMSAGELLRQANQLKRSGRLDEAIAQRLDMRIACLGLFPEAAKDGF
ncbi:hypothetical protein B9T16_27335 [Arthrospira sp. PCC 8006]|uniref:hypothetical protein n=1 Tax=Oscillatoriales TaxID=1150 RepID=UPI00396E80CB